MVGNIKNTKTVNLPDVSYLYVSGGCIFYCYKSRIYKKYKKLCVFHRFRILYIPGGCIFYYGNDRKYQKYKTCVSSSGSILIIFQVAV